ncbi:hypothetical protein JW710_02880 [Candidatus Dojkabacteria bacterium]|nr:hypothetical protein [Candidatus Dojkabacteria bacterium]
MKGKGQTVVIVILAVVLLLCICGSAVTIGILLFGKETEDSDDGGDSVESTVDDSDEDTNLDTDSDSQTDDDDQTSVPQNGRISGSVSYPSEAIPDGMKICAEPNNGGGETCTTDIFLDAQAQFGYGYYIDVPDGSYYVYAQVPGDTYKAYYTEFVTCGLEASCPSHSKIVVTVSSGQNVENIDPGDWYAQ